MAHEVSSQLANLDTKAELHLVQAVAATLSDAAKQEAFLRESNDLVAEAKAPELIRKLLQQRDGILAMPNLEDVEGCFGILFAVLDRVGDVEEAPVLASEIAAALLDIVDDKAPLRLKLVTYLYNMLPSRGPAQLEVLLSVVGYASRAKLLSMLSGFFAGVNDWLAGWELSAEDRRRIYLLMADVLAEVGEAEQSQRFLIKYLATFSGAPADALAAVRPAAARGAAGAVRAPIVSFVEQHNLLGMDAVRQLKEDAKYGPLYQLLSIFSVEKLDAYRAFHKANAATLQQYEIDHEACVANMRLLSLCSLATEHEEIPYSAVASTLQVDENEVEGWVLRCIQAGLMEAKMDQLQQVVVISRCTNRVFGADQWKLLQSRLHTWQKNVQGLLATIQRSNEVQEQRHAAIAAKSTGGGGRKDAAAEPRYEPQYTD